MDQMTAGDVKKAAHSDEPTNNIVACTDIFF